MSKIYIADRETGTFIEEVKNIEEGYKVITKYEKQDKKDKIYTDDFYDIVDEEHCTLIN